MNENALTPKQLILELLDAEPDTMGQSGKLVAAGDVFGFSANQMRVAISRLTSEDMLDSPERGHYELAGHAKAMQQEIQRWRDIEKQLRSWKEDWCVLVVDQLSSEGSTAFRKQTRALELRGMKCWRPGFWVRPNNLKGGVDQLSQDVMALGCDSITSKALLTPADQASYKELLSLWEIDRLNMQYLHALEKIKAAQKRLGKGTTPAVLQEAITLGGGLIKQLLKDPLLPNELLGNNNRSVLLKTLTQYEKAGKKVWREFIKDMGQDRIKTGTES